MDILIVEDNKTDIKIIRQALDKFQINLYVEHEGEAALKYLSNNRPDLIILDLNLMKIDGREILQYIKTHDDLHAIPVIIYTTSRDRNDIKEAYKHGANAYVSKPFSLKDALRAMDALGAFWVGFVRYDE
ncbi:response regulator [Candidatus Parcubacteria bacterium]|nr:MAG: response regulator [Candidatus Parcubacteria bacterium]